VHWVPFKRLNKWSKLLVVCGTQDQAERIFLPALKQRGIRAELAISRDSDAARLAIDRFKERKQPSTDALVTVQMAYEGMDVKQVTHIACVTHIRSKPWLEQCFARAVRNYAEGTRKKLRGYIWVPDDPIFRYVIALIEKEQRLAAKEDIDRCGGLARQGGQPSWLPAVV